ncbi:B12-binding domain-containing radical SAM protein [Geitlerinema sp. PCC 9228]|jgi:radical SAM superfamily enzyme YgiQ (UPF0313 family)|uniref:B12-binding domain-containing radical SAM protein n=1 Tax=Geitlerinema sp. PCC 9228 TaxID=111611 RepID=UPI0008F98F48|nr:B12-binding domain-containing radical SAM protein [Geitlerinema sp. PCC 9228]
MRVLLVYPQFPKSFWSFEKALALVERKALLPPLGLITVAAILPQTWEYKLVDRNVRSVTEEEWEWADLVMFSAMIVQQDDLQTQIQAAKQRGKKVALGGPYPTAVPETVKSMGADYLILDEGEITLPMFVEALERGETEGVFRADEKPDVTQTPIPRFDLLEKDAYDNMSVQFSRGCPFQCEFCDIIVLYGRKPRTKTPEQLLAELDRLYELGWRRSVFLVDDNFIGNKRNVKRLLPALRDWMRDRGHPFFLNTEASVDLAQDQELMDMMLEANFNAVFLGIETPDEDSLKVTKKFQNTRDPLSESVEKIARSGLRVTAGFIIGFDGEKAGAGDRIIRFVEKTAIPMAMFSMLQALPNTALWNRLKQEGRLLDERGNGNQTTLMNFVPTRPVEDIAREYIQAFWELYKPERYLDRTYRHYMTLAQPKHKSPLRQPNWTSIRALLLVLWRQGVLRKTRWKFWIYLFNIMRHKPRLWQHYLSICALYEHFGEYRELVREQIEAQLEEFLKLKAESEETTTEAETDEQNKALVQ